MRRSALVLAMLALISPAALNAQIDTQGKISFQASGFGSVQDETTTVMLIGGITYFVTGGLEVGGDLSANMISNDFTDSTTGFATARARYNFVGQSLFVPYVSLGYGTQLGTEDFTVTTLNAGVGFKRFLNERVSLNGEVNHSTLQMESDAFSSESSMVQFLFGISIYTGN